MNTFVEYNLSAPRGPDCCVSVMNPSAMNIMLQAPAIFMRMGIPADIGFRLVPDASDMSSLFAGLMSIAMRGILRSFWPAI